MYHGVMNWRHALGGLTGSQRTLLQQREVGGRHGRHLESMTSHQKSRLRPSVDSYLLKNNPAKYHPDSI